MSREDDGVSVSGCRFIDTPSSSRLIISIDGRGQAMDNVFIELLWGGVGQLYAIGDVVRLSPRVSLPHMDGNLGLFNM